MTTNKLYDFLNRDENNTNFPINELNGGVNNMINYLTEKGGGIKINEQKGNIESAIGYYPDEEDLYIYFALVDSDVRKNFKSFKKVIKSIQELTNEYDKEFLRFKADVNDDYVIGLYDKLLGKNGEFGEKIKKRNSLGKEAFEYTVNFKKLNIGKH